MASYRRLLARLPGLRRGRLLKILTTLLVMLSVYAAFLQYRSGNELARMNSVIRSRASAPSRHRLETTTGSDVIGDTTSAYKPIQNVSDQPMGGYTAVILLTYYRSGSTFTGEILQQHPDAFYVFEPLRILDSMVWTKQNVEFINGTMLRRGTFDVEKVKIAMMRSWINCDIHSLPVKSMLDMFLTLSKTTSEVPTCLHFDESETVGQRRWDNQLQFCVTQLQNSCRSSRFRILKTIRLRMESVVQLLQEIPELKIIHLVRDPRPTLVSRSYWQAAPDDPCFIVDRTCVEFHCGLVTRDAEVKEALSMIYPNRLYGVLYEDMAEHTITTCADMYRFVGIPFTPGIREFIRNVSSVAHAHGCRLCNITWQQTDPGVNSSMRVNRWKGVISRELLKMIQTSCRRHLQMFGYRPVRVLPFVFKH